MYVCMIDVWSSLIAEYGSTGYSCQSCSWSAEQGKRIFRCPRSCLKTDLARQVRPSRPVSSCSFSTLRLNLVHPHVIPPAFRGGVHLFISPHTIGSVPSLSGHATTYQWRSLSRVRRHKASPQGSSSSAYCLFGHHGLIKARLSLHTTTIC